jgi:hypothetical protein
MAFRALTVRSEQQTASERLWQVGAHTLGPFSDQARLKSR